MKQPNMNLEVLRFSSEEDSTSGLLFDVTNGERKFLTNELEKIEMFLKNRHSER